MNPLMDEGVVVTNAWDRRTYKGVRDQAPALQEAEKAAAERLAAAALLYQDLWAGLYKASPRICDEAPPSLAVNKRLIEEAVKVPEWEDLRESTRLDEWAAALGALSIGPRLLEAIPEEVKEQAAKAEEAESEARRLQAESEAYEDAAQLAQSNGDEEAAKQASARSQELMKKAEAAAAKAENCAGAALNSLAQNQKAVRLAAKEAAKQATETAGQVEAFCWGTGEGPRGSIDSRQVFEIAQKLRGNPALARVAKMAGRMMRIALQKRRTKVRQEPVEVVDVELGDDLSMTLPSELALLGHPVFRKEFLKRYANHELLEYRLEGHEREGRGPIVACLDSSGSMSTNEKDAWAKAVALALFRIALREKRAFAAVIFGSRTEIKAFKWPDPARALPSEIVEMAAFSFCGGTDFEQPLTEAVGILNESPFKKGDIVFITDGECSVSEQFLEGFKKTKEAKEFSCFSVVLPPGTTETARRFSDQTLYAETQKDAEALDLVFSV